MTEKSVIMKESTTDQGLLDELGAGTRRLRLARNLSQAELAGEAGVTRDTVRRMEAGESVSVLTLIRVMRALGQLDSIASLIPDEGSGPLELLERGPAGRQRARAATGDRAAKSEWRWAEEDES